MTTWRTEFSAFILDLLHFLVEKITEALKGEDSRQAALSEAAGAVPILRERVRENAVARSGRPRSIRDFPWAAIRGRLGATLGATPGGYTSKSSVCRKA